MTGPHHYSRAEEILAEIETTNALSNETETALAIRAQAHATLALAAATDVATGPPARAGAYASQSMLTTPGGRAQTPRDTSDVRGQGSRPPRSRW